jgi:MAP3K TRAFs-binding domain
VLLDVIARHGPSSETCGILGRVYKDRWEKAAKAGAALFARGLLARAIDAYVKGFEADWRDAYPGVNAVTLMEIAEPPDPRRAQFVPVVRYAVERRIAAGRPDYWDHATLLELAVLVRDEPEAALAAGSAMAAVHEPWVLDTTAHNLRIIREARARRGEVFAWADAIELALISAVVDKMVEPLQAAHVESSVITTASSLTAAPSSAPRGRSRRPR